MHFLVAQYECHSRFGQSRVAAMSRVREQPVLLLRVYEGLVRFLVGASRISQAFVILEQSRRLIRRGVTSGTAAACVLSKRRRSSAAEYGVVFSFNKVDSREVVSVEHSNLELVVFLFESNNVVTARNWFRNKRKRVEVWLRVR